MRNTHLGLPIAGALLSAIIGGVVWAIIAISTGYEIGFVAWGIGWLAGYAVSYLGKGKITTAHQVIAVIASLIGILLGKYFMIGYYYNETISGIFNNGAVTLFQKNLSVAFGLMDIIFVLLAVATAWKLPARFVSKEAPVANTSFESAE